MGFRLWVIAVGIALSALLYQINVRDLIVVTIGVGRTLRSIDDFPYACRRLQHERLEACEDLWLDDDARVLYAACAGSLGRSQWVPAVGHLNASGRRPGGSELIALHIDSPGPDGFFDMHKIEPVDYVGATGDDTLDLLGFDVEAIDSSTLRFWLINERPLVDADKNLIDASKKGANSTVECFDLKRGTNKMVHIKTVADSQIYTPNNIAALGGGSFVVSNDHSVKVGMRRELDLFIGGGNVVYCPATGSCHSATPKNLMGMPNGLIRGLDGLVYLPSAAGDNIHVMELQNDGNLKFLEAIKLGMPVDNLAVDAKGDIYAAGLPKILEMLSSMKDPFDRKSPSTVWRISKTLEGYRTEIVLEDRDKQVLSGVTVVRHGT